MYAVGVRVVGLVACVILFLFGAKGQDAPADSIAGVRTLDAVEINDSWLHSYSVGNHVAKVDSLALAQQRGGSLAQLLQTQEGIYLKQYGPGMLSTISLRGTSPSQTSLLWNGLPVNFPSLGQADFSLIPNFFIDKAEVFYGGVSPLAGSGAIGGAVAIADQIEKNARTLGLSQEVGSFGTAFSGIKAKLATQTAGLSLAGFYKKSDNNFTYRNLAKAGQPVERQRHGAYGGDGLKAAAFWSPWTKGVFDLEGWLTSYDREIIAPYTVATAGDTQQDRSLRLSLGYTHRFHPLVKWESRAGRINDFIQFNGLASSTTQYMWNNTLEWSLNSKLQMRAGGLVNRIEAQVPEYGRHLTENRSTFFLMANWFAAKRWLLNAKIREGVVEGALNPLSPSVGSELTILERKKGSMVWRSQLSRSYRVPTLNDRYWSPGGNPGLRPEQGWNAESGIDWQITAGAHHVEVSLTAFSHWIDDWILWLPQAEGYWSPANVRNVRSQGTEVSVQHLWQAGSWKLSNRVTYKMTSSRIQKGFSGDDSSIGNQLPYVPFHQGSWVAGGEVGRWNITSSVSFYGARYTLVDNDVKLAAYTLWDVQLQRSFGVRQSLFAAGLRVDNVLGARYENLQYRPMPGRSISFQLNYTLNQNTK